MNLLYLVSHTRYIPRFSQFCLLVIFDSELNFKKVLRFLSTARTKIRTRIDLWHQDSWIIAGWRLSRLRVTDKGYKSCPNKDNYVTVFLFLDEIRRLCQRINVIRYPLWRALDHDQDRDMTDSSPRRPLLYKPYNLSELKIYK